jgi:hypothetical protein
LSGQQDSSESGDGRPDAEVLPDASLGGANHASVLGRLDETIGRMEILAAQQVGSVLSKRSFGAPPEGTAAPAERRAAAPPGDHR